MAQFLLSGINPMGEKGEKEGQIGEDRNSICNFIGGRGFQVGKRKRKIERERERKQKRERKRKRERERERERMKKKEIISNRSQRKDISIGSSIPSNS